MVVKNQKNLIKMHKLSRAMAHFTSSSIEDPTSVYPFCAPLLILANKHV